MKHTIRAFSIGILATGLIFLIAYYFFDNPSSNTSEQDIDEMIATLETEGYRIVSESDYIKLSIQNNNEEMLDEETEEVNEEEIEEEIDEEETEMEESDIEEEEEEETENSDPVTVEITISPGMASSDISNMLENQNLIDDAESFNSYLLEHDYSLYIQMGDHELRTGMSFYEIAEALTN